MNFEDKYYEAWEKAWEKACEDGYAAYYASIDPKDADIELQLDYPEYFEGLD